MQGQQHATDCNAHANKLQAHLPSEEEAVHYAPLSSPSAEEAVHDAALSSPSAEEAVDHAALSFHSDNSNKSPSEKEIHYVDIDFCSRIQKPKPKTFLNDVILGPLNLANQRIKTIRNNITTNTLNANNHNTQIENSWWRKKKIRGLLGAVAVIACVSIVIVAAVIVWNGRYGISEKEKNRKTDISKIRNNKKDKFQIGNNKQGNTRKNATCPIGSNRKHGTKGKI